MEAVPEHFDHPADAAEFRRSVHREGVELYRAHIVSHAFEPHAHDAFGLGAIEAGVERYRYAGGEHVAAAGSLVHMNDDVLHTGQSASAEGWRYRMAYVAPAVVAEVTGASGWHFDVATQHDPVRAARVTTLLRTLWASTDEPLAFDSALSDLLEAFRPHVRQHGKPDGRATPAFGAVVDYLHAHLGERLTLDELAGVAGLSPFHFLRRFRARHGATPQQMLMALRLAEAKRQLARGEPAAQVAAAVGLADQSHLTRAFARRYGTTPVRYQRQVTA